MQRTSGTSDRLFPTTEDEEAALAQQLHGFVEMLQSLPGGPSGYRLRRILLTNFWLYGQQEFEIPHGRVFLAGENASGKSTVLTAALPLALDGDLRPNRIDTFGGRERHIEYYVLGGADSATPFHYERRTAYIALEFEWCNPDEPPIAQELRRRWENGERERTRFLTIGLSLAGNANASDRIRPLRFLITDGSRLGYDLDTVYESGSKHEKRAYDHSRFKQLLEGHGILCETQAEYERQVARYLFGFNDVKDFQKLIDLLLVLRRPNLSTELNFSKVHDYLKQSLRKISSETTQRVIGTIERIDAIQGEIERIQEAYNATERVHLAVQNLVLTRTRVAADEYRGTQRAEESIQNRVNKLRKDLANAHTERKKADAQVQNVQAELYAVHGQINAVEASEGLQVARQLTTVRERAQDAETQLHLQVQSKEAAQQSVRSATEQQQRLSDRFAQTLSDIVTHLSELRSSAVDESYWEVAALQLDGAIEQCRTLSVEATVRPELSSSVTALTGIDADERISWLHHLEELHQQKERADGQVQQARSLETTRFQELDEARRRFQSARNRSSIAQQQLQQALEPFLVESEQASSLPLFEEDELLEAIQSDESPTGAIVEGLATVLQNARQVIATLERELSEAADLARGEMDDLQLLTGGKQHEIAELQTRFAQKQAEPEVTPAHPTRRDKARALLAEHGIAALPLYALLDFAPTIERESEQAGRIEQMIEDAGLLDALVIAPAQQAAADAFLQQEDLTDCRLTFESQHDSKMQSHLHSWVRFDASALAQGGTQHEPDARVWETLITTFLSSVNNGLLQVHEDGFWTHGLLHGYAGSGTARFIGKETRLRAKQRELEALDVQRRAAEEELAWLHRQLAHYELQMMHAQEQQQRVRAFLQESGLEAIYAELAQMQHTLEEAKGKYQKARQQTQETRQTYNTLIARLERESRGIGPLASSMKSVQHAIIATSELKTRARGIQQYYTTVTATWEEFGRGRNALMAAKNNETTVVSLYERIQQQVLQVQAEMQELQRIAAGTDVEALSERLRLLRTQNESLTEQLDEAKSGFIRADEREQNAQSNLTEAEVLLQQAQAERMSKQERFMLLLTSYPVAMLVEVQQKASERGTLGAAVHLLGELAHEGDVLARKERLENTYRDAYNQLSRVFNREQSTLLEYGPDLDDQGQVQFLHEQKSRPVELLELLSERIEMQKTLLGQEERPLFEDFLLQEIAEAIRTHM